MTCHFINRPMRQIITRQHWSVGLSTILLVATLAVLAQSYTGVKLLFLAFFIIATLVDAGTRKTIILYPRLLFFYLAMASFGFIWAIIGLSNPTNYFTGIMDSLRLYCLWSCPFLLIFTLLRNQSSFVPIHYALVLAGILIFVINGLGLLDEYSGLDLFSDGFRKELNLRVGINDGYIQITSRNIGSLFFITPYLLAFVVRGEGEGVESTSAKLSLAACLILTAVSGRRALLLVVAISPLLILLISVLSGSYSLLKAGSRTILITYLVTFVAVIGAASTQVTYNPDNAYVQRVEEAFSSSDERTIQKPYLLEAFRAHPVIGAGYGAFAGYQRNDEAPWIYELTYHQLLFNVGIVGTILFSSLVSGYFLVVLNIIRRSKNESAVPFALTVGLISLAIGAYSNPYLGSFDFLFFVGFLPFLSTYSSGYFCADRSVKN